MRRQDNFREWGRVEGNKNRVMGRGVASRGGARTLNSITRKSHFSWDPKNKKKLAIHKINQRLFWAEGATGAKVRGGMEYSVFEGKKCGCGQSRERVGRRRVVGNGGAEVGQESDHVGPSDGHPWSWILAASPLRCRRLALTSVPDPPSSLSSNSPMVFNQGLGECSLGSVYQGSMPLSSLSWPNSAQH